MKVLFAVSNENISESIVKKYQQEYKEILSYKNVYYFNAILKELQKDKTYDRIVISEDLEPFANNNYEVIDKFIFEKLDSISDEATDLDGNDIPIILIGSDRRSKSEPMLVKLFGIGVYSALLGQDRSIEEVCGLIYKPRTKKEAKLYYKIDVDDVKYQSESENDVSEEELQNILAYYKRLGKNEDKYVESFYNLANQYTDTQLKLIINFLPLNVKAILEAKSPKYQELVTFGTKNGRQTSGKKGTKKEPEDAIKINLIEQAGKTTLGKPVVIPSAVDPSKVTKIEKQTKQEKVQTKKENASEELTQPVKRGRGRPPKVQPIEKEQENVNLFDLADSEQEEKKEKVAEAVQPAKRGRGRPPKVQPIEKEPEDVNLFGLAEEEEKEEKESAPILPGWEEEQPEIQQQEEPREQQTPYQQSFTNNQNTSDEMIEDVPYTSNTNHVVGQISQEKKIVAFIGTSKNGTTFLINNLAELFSKQGIKTAIFDTTKNKNDYYIYTNNEEKLMNAATQSFQNLKRGIPEGVKINKYLDVYTNLPSDNNEELETESMLSTLVNHYSLTLMDCDFDTNLEWIRRADEIYLVQSMDVLTIQPLTTYLKDLQTKGMLQTQKLKIVINKYKTIKMLTEKTLIAGMSRYKDPSMSVMSELFNENTIPYLTVPFEEQTYVRYLEGLVDCHISLNGYSKFFMQKLTELSNMVYPLLASNSPKSGKSKFGYKPKQANTSGYVPNSSYNSGFSNSINETLNQMKNRY